LHSPEEVAPAMANEEQQKSLKELEGYSMGEPEFPSGLVLRCHALWRKPLADLTPGDLCILIGQGMSLSHLVPLALEMLEKDPLLDAEYFEGDLLAALADRDPLFFTAHPEWLEVCKSLVYRALEVLEVEDELDLSFKLKSFLARFEDRP
jgi:hypothetical protein